MPSGGMRRLSHQTDQARGPAGENLQLSKRSTRHTIQVLVRVETETKLGKEVSFWNFRGHQQDRDVRPNRETV